MLQKKKNSSARLHQLPWKYLTSSSNAESRLCLNKESLCGALAVPGNKQEKINPHVHSNLRWKTFVLSAHLHWLAPPSFHQNAVGRQLRCHMGHHSPLRCHPICIRYDLQARWWWRSFKVRDKWYSIKIEFFLNNEYCPVLYFVSSVSHIVPVWHVTVKETDRGRGSRPIKQEDAGREDHCACRAM